jgi:predicted ArsR family transcriptional regulator
MSGSDPQTFQSDRPATAVFDLLTDPNRRALYEYVTRAARAVDRDEAAAGTGIPRQTAAYHLDRMARLGFLDVHFSRRSGKSGPGAGRPAKFYRVASSEIDATVPPRRYLLAARIMLDALSRHTDVNVVAREAGVKAGEEGLDVALEATGYQPIQEGDEISFENCPFHQLVVANRELTCSLNLALVGGMLEGAKSPGSARLEPREGRCCVRVRLASA